MGSQIQTKEKIMAVLSVFFLFIVIGGIFFSISHININKNIALKKQVIQLQAEKQSKQILSKIEFSNFSTSTVITSKAYLTLAITAGGEKKILIEKNATSVMPIASITKLMAAIITEEGLNPETEIMATTDYVGQEESAFILEIGKKYLVKNLLVNALISSDNDSVRLLGSALGTNNFIAKMNTLARTLNLDQTKFFNITGLDPILPASEFNTSSAYNLADLIVYISKNHPEILKITTLPEYNLCDINNYCKIVKTTNKLLDDKNLNIIGGKTGSTDIALKNLVLVTKISDGISLINIVLGSTDSFADTLSLINQVKIIN